MDLVVRGCDGISQTDVGRKQRVMANAMDDARILYSAIDLDSEDERAFEDALQQLSLVLRQDPLGIDVPVARLEGKLREEVLGILQPCDDLVKRIADLSEFLSDHFQRWTQVYFACPESHEFAQASLRNNPDALWGSAYGALGLIYHRVDRYIIWHEALHLLGAEDCYDLPDEGPTCGLSSCIMQYAPCSSAVRTWPFICKANVRRMQEAAIRWSGGGGCAS